MARTLHGFSPTLQPKEDFIEKDKSSVVTFCSSLVGIALFVSGYWKSSKAKVDVWQGMLLAMEDFGLLLLKLFAVCVLLLFIYLLSKITFERAREFYVTWIESEEWCKKIDQEYTKTHDELRKFVHDLDDQKSERKRLSGKMDVLYRQLKELREFTGIDAQKAQADAEKAIVASAE